MLCRFNDWRDVVSCGPGTNVLDPRRLNRRGSAAAGSLPLRVLTDVPLNGGTTRFNYQSLDNGRLYIAHLGSDLMTVFDVNKQRVIDDVKDLKRVHGVLTLPALHRIYASAKGTNELVVMTIRVSVFSLECRLAIILTALRTRVKTNKIYFSDLNGKTDTVIDSKTNQRVTTIALGGGVGNSQYDSGADRIFVTVMNGKSWLRLIRIGSGRRTLSAYRLQRQSRIVNRLRTSPCICGLRR